MTPLDFRIVCDAVALRRAHAVVFAVLQGGGDCVVESRAAGVLIRMVWRPTVCECLVLP